MGAIYLVDAHLQMTFSPKTVWVLNKHPNRLNFAFLFDFFEDFRVGSEGALNWKFQRENRHWTGLASNRSLARLKPQKQ